MRLADAHQPAAYALETVAVQLLLLPGYIAPSLASNVRYVNWQEDSKGKDLRWSLLAVADRLFVRIDGCGAGTDAGHDDQADSEEDEQRSKGGFLAAGLG